METAPTSPGMARIDAWEQYPWLRAAFSTRLGGGSQVYGPNEQNLGWTGTDQPALVAANRERFIAAVAGQAGFELVTVRQTHSDNICQVLADQGPLATPEGKAVLQGDGLMTDQMCVLLGVQTADCVPVLVADTKNRVVAAYHAGWRGTVAGIVQRGIEELRLRYGTDAQVVVAAIGPCIAACCFEVGGEVRDAFRERFSYADELFSQSHSDGQKLHVDLVEANRRQLFDAGVPAENITAIGECTVCTRVEGGKRKYFSHRAEQGFTGRMLSVIGVAAI